MAKSTKARKGKANGSTKATKPVSGTVDMDGRPIKPGSIVWDAGNTIIALVTGTDENGFMGRILLDGQVGGDSKRFGDGWGTYAHQVQVVAEQVSDLFRFLSGGSAQPATGIGFDTKGRTIRIGSIIDPCDDDNRACIVEALAGDCFIGRVIQPDTHGDVPENEYVSGRCKNALVMHDPTVSPRLSPAGQLAHDLHSRLMSVEDAMLEAHARDPKTFEPFDITPSAFADLESAILNVIQSQVPVEAIVEKHLGAEGGAA